MPAASMTAARSWILQRGAGYHGYTLDHGVFTPFDYPGTSSYTVLSSINNLGQIVGYYESPASGGYDPGFVNFGG